MSGSGSDGPFVPHFADVSVLMPVYNGERYVAEALRSIRAQTVPCREVIAVDDGSTDRTAELIGQFSEVTLIRKEHSGIVRTLNRALEHASGEYLAFIDADDRWIPRKTEIQLAILRENPAISIVFGYARRFLM